MKQATRLLRVAFFAFFNLAAFAMSASAATVIPPDACSQTPALVSKAITVAPNSKQPQLNWQREGHEINIEISDPAIPAQAQAVVCFRWALRDDKAPGAAKYLSDWLPSPTRALVEVKPSAPVKFTAVVPDLLEHSKPPKRPDQAPSEELAGNYGGNNAYAVASIAVLLFEEGKPAPVIGFQSKDGIGIVAPDNYCDAPGLTTTTSSGVASLDLHKNWQPIGGQFNFSVVSSKPIPNDALVKVCFRWKLASGDPGRFWDGSNVHLLEAVKDRTLKITATVPDIPCSPSWLFGERKTRDDCPDSRGRTGSYSILNFAVPRADARLLVFDTDDSPILDITTFVGVTHPAFAIPLVIAIMLIICLILWLIARKRLRDIAHSKPVLSLITTTRGFASLSQFQIILWTFVVLASVVYVIALSGDLIEITSGTLVLLGISGGATVAAKLKSESDDKKPLTIPDQVAAAENVSLAQYDVDIANRKLRDATDSGRKDAQAELREMNAKRDQALAMAALSDASAAATKARNAVAAAADDEARKSAAAAVQAAEEDVLKKRRELAIKTAIVTKEQRIRHPAWSDLVMEEVHGREIDVTRVQMLCFTLVTAIFVCLSVITNYVIPEIPSGYLILMGISNGVYVGSKFVTNTASQ